MANDLYTRIANAPVGSTVFDAVGLPRPTELERYELGDPLISGEVLAGAAPGGRLGSSIAGVLASSGAEARSTDAAELRQALADAGLDTGLYAPEAGDGSKFKALVFDASGIKRSEDLKELREFFSGTIRSVLPSGRLVVLGTPPEDCSDPREATCQRALEGFVRAASKELRGGATGQLIYIASGGEGAAESTLRFYLSPRSAYVDGQVVRVGSGKQAEAVDWDEPLAGKVALVTGASRGIGASIAEVLARDGAHVVGLDVPQTAADLETAMTNLGGSSLAADITSDTAPKEIADHLASAHDGVDIVVHNAGVTRDKTLGRMTPEHWDVLIAINLTSEERINDELIERKLIRPNGRVVCVSSISGIAGNAGQTNYSTSKAGVIGMVQSMAPVFAKQDVTINAVAPGFIETAMTAAMPVGIREAGRRLSSLKQGGLPVDVAETIAWYASPGSSAVTGNVVRVCGQALIGA